MIVIRRGLTVSMAGTARAGLYSGKAVIFPRKARAFGVKSGSVSCFAWGLRLSGRRASLFMRNSADCILRQHGEAPIVSGQFKIIYGST